ncbi:branched-chain amino acid ABC transporter permease [Alicyclobacillus sp. ALC3]|uniref:branched-chain amino acid ABC transporter permease n=1 Tax=Alicyclobacillus sp. ALC3 TaxID=2796143 RepID=UPI0023787931|nr:branched-chain amino acid ABC transporter permease [Alicyclobacillus sp. ALC3]WDL98250.1 branched-chain amino acid ABC transporter permease [Alicyclobacillus sp. ALC3]
MTVALTLLINGVANSAIYFLMAAGLTLIFGLLRVINFAHGGVYLWGAYLGTFLYTATGNFFIAVCGGLVTGALLGWLSERGLLAAIYGQGTQQLLLTMGIFIILSELIKIPFGRDPINSSPPPVLGHSWIVGHVVIVEYQVFAVVAGALVYVALVLLLSRTRLGLVVRAGVTNPELVQSRGVAIKRVFTAVFVLGAALAGFAGALAGPYFGSVTPGMGMDMQLNAFIIVVLGGLGSLKGSLVGSLLIGVATAVVSYYASSLAVLSSVIVMAIVLVIRPNGLFGSKEVV